MAIEFLSILPIRAEAEGVYKDLAVDVDEYFIRWHVSFVEDITHLTVLFLQNFFVATFSLNAHLMFGFF